MMRESMSKMRIFWWLLWDFLKESLQEGKLPHEEIDRAPTSD